MRARPPTPVSLLAALLAGGLLASPAGATTMVTLGTADLVRAADVVGIAEVLSVESVRQGGRIFTRARMQVSRPVKGAAAGERLTVLVPGGEVDGWVQQVAGAPRLREGETAVVFLERAGAGTLRFVGLEQGRLEIRPDARAPGGWVVRRSLTARLVRPGPGGTWQEAPAPPATEPLDAYLRGLDALVRAEAP